MNKLIDIRDLSSIIQKVHSELQISAANAVNQALTMRNWLIGYYIVEYEQNGTDRADYGANLLVVLAEKIAIKGLTAPELSRTRQFYQTYSHFLGTVSQEFDNTTLPLNLGTVPQNLDAVQKRNQIRESATSEFENQLLVPPKVMLAKLSFSHFIELIKISEPLKRIFYELECIKGTWSVRELKRQIASLYFERSGLSQQPEKLAELVSQKTHPQEPKDIINQVNKSFWVWPKLAQEYGVAEERINYIKSKLLTLGYGVR